MTGAPRTWLAPEARMRRLSVHGKSPEPARSMASRTSEAASSSATKDTPRSKKGKELESPNTPFDGAQEFSQTTSGAGGSQQSPSEVDSGSHGKRHSSINRKPSLIPKAPLSKDQSVTAFDEQANMPVRPAARGSHAIAEQESRQAAKDGPAGIPIPPRPGSVAAGNAAPETGRQEISPSKSARFNRERFEDSLQQRTSSLGERRDGTRLAGWFQNDTYGVEAPAAIPGWKRPSITVPSDAESSISTRHLSPSGAGSSMPWPAISPKESVTAEQEAWYIEQVAVALSGRDHAVETIQALLRSCRAKTVSSAAAMHQVASLLAGHPILIEGFTAFLPDKTAFFQLDDRSGGPAYPLKHPHRDAAAAEGAPLMSSAHAPSLAPSRSSSLPAGAERRARAKATSTRSRGGGLRGCGCWHQIKATHTAELHLPWWTMAFSLACIGVFLYMAGNYGTFHLLQQQLAGPEDASAQSAEERQQLLGFTPDALRAWFRAAPGWRSFDGAYLVAWGARYAPDLARSRWWLWVTSGLLHTDFMHMAGSLLPWAVLSFLLEINHGSIRVFALWFVSLLGGAFTSGILDAPCQVVVGCNAALMGMLPWLFGAFLADFSAISWSWFQLPLAVCAIVLHLVIAILQRDASYHSNWADLGGFLCGLLPAVIFLPCPSDQRWATAKLLLARAGRLCCRCGCVAPRTASAELALMAAAADEEGQPLQAPAPTPAMQALEPLRSSQEAGEFSLDMHRFYSKHRLPALAPYDKSLRSQWDIEQSMAPLSARSGSIPAHRGILIPSHSPTVQLTEGRSRHASPHQISPALRSSAESLPAGRQPLRSSVDAAEGLQGQVPSLPEEAVAGEEPAEGTPAGAHRCCACCACANVAHGAFCLFSVVAFFGILVGAPVYLYLVKLPKLACAAAV